MPPIRHADATAESTQKITIRCTSCATWNRIDARRAPDRPKCGTCAAPLDLTRPVALDDDTFDRVIAGTDLPVLVDFYADWCGPCRMMAPAVDALAGATVGRALVAKLDTDRAPRAATRFQIRGIPTTIVFRAGTESRRASGVLPLAALRSMLD